MAPLHIAAVLIVIGNKKELPVYNSEVNNSLLSKIFEEKPFLFAEVNLTNLRYLYEYLKKEIKKINHHAIILMDGGTGRFLDGSGWYRDPTALAIFTINQQDNRILITHDTVFPVHFLRIFNNNVKYWYALFSHIHEDHSPRNFAKILNYLKNINVKILTSKYGFYILTSDDIVRQFINEPSNVTDLISYMEPHKKTIKWLPANNSLSPRVIEISSKRVEENPLLGIDIICLGKGPHTPPEEPLIYSIIDKNEEFAHIIFSDNAFFDSNGVIPYTKLLPNIQLLSKEAPENLLVTFFSGILYPSKQHPSAIYGAYVADLLKQLDMRIKLIMRSHIPAEYYIALEAVMNNINSISNYLGYPAKIIEDAVETLLSFSKIRNYKEPLYRYVNEFIINSIREIAGYKVDIVSADNIYYLDPRNMRKEKIGKKSVGDIIYEESKKFLLSESC